MRWFLTRPGNNFIIQISFSSNVKKNLQQFCVAKKNIFQVEFSENYQWFWLGAIVGLSIFGCINYKIVIIIRWQYWIIFIGIEIRFRGPKRRFTIEIINQSFGKCQFFRFISFVKNMSRMSRGPGPGVAGVARATPRFLNLLYFLLLATPR